MIVHNRLHPATLDLDPVLRDQIAPVLPQRLRQAVLSLPDDIRRQIEEVRIRLGRPLQIYYGGREGFVTLAGSLSSRAEDGHLIDDDDIAQTLNLMTHSSLYALEEELRRGYLTIPGGHRVGLAGRALLDGAGQLRGLKEITTFNLRIARDVRHAAEKIRHLLIDSTAYRLYNTLLISPPQCGKTTLLRDLARHLSCGTLHPKLPPQKVGIVDERSEVAASWRGVPQHDLGPRTDVLDGCPKAEGMQMMIRSMSPHVLVTDEIGRPEDGAALLEAIHAGVHVVTTAHGFGMHEVRNRPVLRQLFEQGAFHRYIVLSRRRGPCTIEGVYDRRGERVQTGSESHV
ncbi:stage III sporulation protein AA [Tumebacillus flagellatus]|uniref:Stage III sporulation protein AA n=1 Tax=Tumebacillus flagellatus TaxID=1157490 RepID=A0A074LN46_9BACL|nr:stage III sporulation protein AA [Tumebacillus flagellatus]KEO82534.1 stage III sporulation protein AA [Tumebacillus flagellatus]